MGAGGFAERLRYLLLAPQGYGKPYTKDRWDAEYREGAWGHFTSPDELGRYMIIVGYLQFFHKSRHVLDVGCGPGRLLQLLTTYGISSYHGIDLSSQAIGAAARPVGNVQFSVADFETWTIPTRYDAIVFNETLYYAKRPVETLLRYRNSLEENGIFIVSIFRTGIRGAIWRSLDKAFEVVHATTVQNPHRQVSDVRILRPRSA